jgi:hypothetical protein
MARASTKRIGTLFVGPTDNSFRVITSCPAKVVLRQLAQPIKRTFVTQ